MLCRKNKGVSGLVGVFIGIMVVIIIAVSVVIPTIDTSLASATWTSNYSSAKTLIDLAPLLIAVVIVLAIVGVMRM